MLRYLMVKFDFVRVKFSNTQNSQLSTLFTKNLIVDVLKTATNRYDTILNLSREFFEDLSSTKDFVNFTKNNENSKKVIDFIN
jgi:hypothetical protein